MSESPQGVVEAPTRRPQSEIFQGVNKEIEIRRSISPAVAHVLTGSESERGRFHPDSNGELTQPEKDKLAGLSADGLAFNLADEVSLRSREETKSDWTEWHSDLEKWTKSKFGQRHTPEDVMRLEVLQAVHLMSDTGDAQNKYLATVEEFRNRYFWDKDTGKPKSDIKQFVMDVAEICKDADGNIDMHKLEARLNSVQELLVAFGEKTNANLMVRDFALSYGVLKQAAETRQVVVDVASESIQRPVDAPEQVYLKALADQALTIRTAPVPTTPTPTPPPGTSESSTAQERSGSQPDPKHELKVEGKEGQPGMTIRMGGESIPSPTHPNEDNYWFDARYMAGFVADGMGGMGDRSKGDPARASKAVRESMQHSFETMPPLPTLQEAREWLRDQVMLANAAVLREQQKPDNPMAAGAGSTLTAVMVWRGPKGEMELITANVGDSRMSYIRNNKLKDLTFDQSLGLRLKGDGSWRPADEVRDLQREYSELTDPSHLTGEDKAYWDSRSKIFAAVDGKLNPRNIEVQSHTIAYGSKIRILGRSDGLTDVTTNRATIAVASDFEDPQQAAHALIEKAVRDDSSLRTKGRGDDKSIFVMDITIDPPSTAEIDAIQEGPVTYDDQRLAQMMFNEDSDLYTQLTEFLPDSERGAWPPDQEQRAEDGMRELFNVEYEGFPLLLPGSTLQEARDALHDKSLVAERQRAGSEPTRRKLDYQIGSFGGGHFLHFGKNFDPPPGTEDAFPSAHRIYAIPQKWAVGEVAAEVIRRARAEGYEPYGKVWDEAKVMDVKQRSSRKDRILFLPRTQREQDILLKALKDIQAEKPGLFEDNPLILTEKVAGLDGVGIAEEPVQNVDTDGVFEKKSFNSSREELLGAAREYILSKWISPKADGTVVPGPSGRFVDRRVLALQRQLADGTHTTDELITFLQKVIRGLSPKYNVDPDHISRNLQHS